MQTFLPYARFNKCAYCLDNKRLFKQAVECKQILLALGVSVGAHRPTGSKAWTNHPAVRMWRGYELALAIYSVHIAQEAQQRKFRSNLLAEFLGVVRRLREPDKPARYPPWLRDWGIMTSHRSNLLRKDQDWYSQFGWLVKPDLPYKWPVPNENDRDDELPSLAQSETGTRRRVPRKGRAVLPAARRKRKTTQSVDGG